MSGYVKYCDDGGRNMSLKIEDDSLLVKYNKIRNKIKKILTIKFHSQPVYDEKQIKTKVKTFNGVGNIVFSNDKILKESIHHICLAAISIDSVMKIDKVKLSSTSF